MTALQVLEASGLEYGVQGEGASAFVTDVAGYSPEKKEFWALYVNDSLSPVGAGSATVKAGDMIEWRLEIVE